MFHQLTKYLSVHKKLSIPAVGSFEIMQQPAALDVADKLIYPPAFSAHYSSENNVKEHQLNYLSVDLKQDRALVQQQLEVFGRQLKEKINKEPVSWNGVGRLYHSGNSVVFNADAISIGGLQPIPAHKVLRENVQHNVLVGTTERQSGEMHDLLHPEERKRTYTILVACIIAVLAIAFIVFHFYKEGFQPAATGTKSHFKVQPAPSGHK